MCSMQAYPLLTLFAILLVGFLATAQAQSYAYWYLVPYGTGNTTNFNVYINGSEIVESFEYTYARQLRLSPGVADVVITLASNGTVLVNQSVLFSSNVYVYASVIEGSFYNSTAYPIQLVTVEATVTILRLQFRHVPCCRRSSDYEPLRRQHPSCRKYVIHGQRGLYSLLSL